MRASSSFLLLLAGWSALACQSTSSPAATGTVAGSAGLGGSGSAVGGAATGGAASGGGPAAGGAAGSGGASSSTLGLSLGPFATCAVLADQSVKCAGRCGPVGKGGSRDAAPAGLHAKAVAVGREFACALLVAPAAGSVVQCWGGGLATELPTAADAPALADAVELVAGDEHACVRNGSGVVNCWGDVAHAAPAALVAKELAASGAMTCAIAMDDSVQCWGHRAAEPPADLKALHVAVSSQLTDAKLGPRFGCAVTLGNDVRCWGDDPGQVQTVPAALKAKAVALGRSNACAIGMDDALTCWGAAPRYGLALPAGSKARSLSLSFRSAGALGLDDKLLFWGDLSDARSML